MITKEFLENLDINPTDHPRNPNDQLYSIGEFFLEQGEELIELARLGIWAKESGIPALKHFCMGNGNFIDPAQKALDKMPKVDE